jgi:hypothetical protein
MTRTTACLLAPLLALLGAGALAQDHDHGHAPAVHEAPPRAAPLHLDAHYHHDRYYPPHGYVAPAVPAGSVGVDYRGGRYYFHAGVWFRPWHDRYVVVAPPIGIVVPLLPPGVTTVWIGGTSYYYANGTYYAPAGAAGYSVVAPPPGADVATPDDAYAGEMPPDGAAVASPVAPSSPVPPAPPIASAAPPEPVIYPRNGQSAAQTESDRRECERWATSQPGAVADASVFQRAVAACMDGRGYSLR